MTNGGFQVGYPVFNSVEPKSATGRWRYDRSDRYQAACGQVRAVAWTALMLSRELHFAG